MGDCRLRYEELLSAHMAMKTSMLSTLIQNIGFWKRDDEFDKCSPNLSFGLRSLISLPLIFI
jgi:hypothetical protein